MPRLSTRHSTSRESGRERAFTDDEAGRPGASRETGATPPPRPFFAHPAGPRDAMRRPSGPGAPRPLTGAHGAGGPGSDPPRGGTNP
jgi:hypothetical protein